MVKFNFSSKRKTFGACPFGTLIPVNAIDRSVRIVLPEVKLIMIEILNPPELYKTLEVLKVVYFWTDESGKQKNAIKNFTINDLISYSHLMGTIERNPETPVSITELANWIVGISEPPYHAAYASSSFVQAYIANNHLHRMINPEDINLDSHQLDYLCASIIDVDAGNEIIPNFRVEVRFRPDDSRMSTAEPNMLFDNPLIMHIDQGHSTLLYARILELVALEYTAFNIEGATFTPSGKIVFTSANILRELVESLVRIDIKSKLHPNAWLTVDARAYFEM